MSVSRLHSSPQSARMRTSSSIRLYNKTRDELVRLGKKNQSYDSIVSMLISEHYAKALASALSTTKKDEED